MTLKEARKQAKDLTAMIASGSDEEKAQARKEASTLAAACSRHADYWLCESDWQRRHGYEQTCRDHEALAVAWHTLACDLETL